MEYNDRDLLARTLMAEAGNQGLGGMLAAGSVIMNRVKTPGYGDGVRGVILKPGQFSAWNSLTGYAGGEQGQNMAAIRPSADAYNAADLLLSGNYQDPTGGATHYYNPSISQPKWGLGAGGEWTRIGDHVFGRADAGRAAGRGSAPSASSSAPRISTKGEAPMPPASLLDVPAYEEERTILGGLLSPDKRDRLVMALEGMTLNPNVAMMQAAGRSIEGRTKAREEGKAKAAQAERANRTIQWLQSQGRDDLAQAVSMGGLGAGDAVKLAMSPGEQRKGVEINGKLVDPVTGQLIADYSTPEAKKTGFIVTGDQAQSYGLDPKNSYNILIEGGVVKASQIGGGGDTINVGGGEDFKLVGTEGLAVIKDPTAPGGIRMVELPGSPAAAKSAAAKETDVKATSKKEQTASVVTRSVDQLLAALDKDAGMLDLPEAGIVGNLLARTGINQEAVTFKNTLESLQSNVAFGTLQEMREASKTGGALGGVSERELVFLLSALGNIQQSTDPATLRENLLEVKRILTKIENDPVAGKMYRSEGGSAGGGFSVTGRVD